MSKILFFFALLCSFSFVNAQTSKGDWMVGGTFTSSASKDYKNFNLNPSAGYFVIPNLAVGANLGLGLGRGTGLKSSTYGVGPFARYYIGKGKLKPIVQASYNFSRYRERFETDNYHSFTNVKNSSYSFGGGVAYFLSENVSIDALLLYDRKYYQGNGSSGQLSFAIGFQIYLFRKKNK